MSTSGGSWTAVALFVAFWCGHARTASISNLTGSICVTDDGVCSKLRQVSGGLLTCTLVRDRVDCLKKMQNHEADFGFMEAEDLNVAADSFTDKFQAPIQIWTGEDVKKVYLLVHNASNPNIKTVCHPGMNFQRYYPRALYRPVTSTSDEFLPDIESHIEALSNSWDQACIPGAWSPDPLTDRQLKQKHPQLCSLCLSQTCDAEDPYAGSRTLQCLLDGVADAAFVSDVDFNKARTQNPEVENLSHYCRSGNGTIVPLGDWTAGDGEPCDWGRRPLPVLLSPTCEDNECVERQAVWLKALTSQAKAVSEVLGLDHGTQFKVLRDVPTPLMIIKQAGYKFNMTQVKNPVRFCVHNEAELEKCHDLQMAARAYGTDAGIGVGCIMDPSSSHCYPDIYFGNADVIALDGGDVYQVTQDFGFDRVLSEVYDVNAATPSSSYYAVAVVRADSNITSFSDLQDRKSCHTGLGKTAGWKMPLATLLRLRLIDPLHCNYVNAAAEYFSGGSCAPGAKLPAYNKYGNYEDRLCRLCIGEGENHCARSSSEPFYSYNGAFKCLVHGGGDVAFVKHTTVPQNTGDSNSEARAGGQLSENYKLLCPTGGTAAISEFQTCNLALVPAHEVVVSGRMSTVRKSQVRQVLLGASEAFKGSAPGSKTFKLFGSYKGKSDLLFKNTAVGLKALSEDTPEERKMKKVYFLKLNELHRCEVRVCALEEQMADCEAMVQTMSAVGQQFVCVSARDRLDCVRRVVRGQVDMTPLPGSYLRVNSNLRVIAVARDPLHSQDEYRYKAVVVVRRARVSQLRDLRGKKACHTGYGRTTGWRIPLALLKRAGVIQPPCNLHKSSLEHEMEAVSTTFNRACIPGDWATSSDVDEALKERYKAMCSMCRSQTCDGNDDYAGYKGALWCLTMNNGDVAFSKLNVVQEFFLDNRAADVNDYGLMCQDGRIVGINAPNASDCFWAARPWDVYVTHGGASDDKVQKLFWALSQAKREGEKDLGARKWYFSTLGIHDSFYDIVPVLDNMQSGHYYAKTRMDIVEAEKVCDAEEKVRFCVTSEEESKKCDDLSAMLKLRGVSPDLDCVRGKDVSDCVNLISLSSADVVSLNDIQRFRAHQEHNIADLLIESYTSAESNLYYLVAVIKTSSGIQNASDLSGKTTCHISHNSSLSGFIDYNLANCLSGTSDFFHTYEDAFSCLVGTNKDVAFVKHAVGDDDEVIGDTTNAYKNPKNFQLLCADGVLPLARINAKACNLGRVPGDVIVTRQPESSSRQEDMRHVLLKAVRYFGNSDSFFRLFYNYFSKNNLLFRDDTMKLIPVSSDNYQNFFTEMWQRACNLYDHHLKSGSY